MNTLAFIDLKRQYQALRADIQAGLDRVLETAVFVDGPEVEALERELADYVGVSAVVVNGSGTAALEMTLMAWGLGPGDAVFCPSFTFMATAEAVALRGAVPIFVDIDARTYTLDPADLENKIHQVHRQGRLRPRGIIAVDLFGLPADYPALARLAETHGLFLLEDSAQGFGGRIGDRRAGSFGQAAATSFFPTKPLAGYGDGGAVMTDDQKLADLLRSLGRHGSGAHKYEHVRLGVNSRLDALQAAILRAKLSALPRELEERQRVARAYDRHLAGRLPVPSIPDDFYSAWAQYTLRVPANGRDRISARLKANGVPTMVYYPLPLHLQTAFSYLGGRRGELPETEKAAAEVLSLPMHPYLHDDEIEHIAAQFLAAMDETAESR